MDGTRAVLDACVLYPAPLRDFLMECAVAGFYQPRWSDAIHDEWIRNLLANRSDLLRSPGSANVVTLERLTRTSRLMDRAIPRAKVSGYEPLIGTIDLPDPDDRHVLAAAIHSGAGVIVTFNLRDFPDPALCAYGVTAVSPDSFLMAAIGKDETRLIDMARSHRSRLISPPKTVDEYLATLRLNHLTRIADLLEQNAGDL